MLDKSKYASHGAFMKTNSDNFIAKCDKLRLGT